MRTLLFFIFILSFIPISAQELSGTTLLERAIAHHDPDHHWRGFMGELQVTMQTPNSSDRVSQVHIDLPKERFILKVEKDNDHYTYILEKDVCTLSLNGKKDFTTQDAKKYRLSCERGAMFKNYYTYLYGLPMKLGDPGTIIDEKVLTKTFKGKEYLVLKVKYEQGVGDDTWYFYFDPTTYAMEVYQFYHDESKNDGEYILLEGIEEINGIKMPKVRSWYYNKDDKYLGTDILGDL